MKPLLLLLACACASRAPAASPLARVATPEVVVFTDVSVVDPAAGAILPGQTVVVRGARIESVGDATPPSGAMVIAGSGKFLVPGLIDMHVHVKEADLAAYADSGVTTVRNMWGFPSLPATMKRVLDRNELAPTVLSASNGVDGPGSPWPYTELITDPALADALIDRLASEGWRWIKVYPHLSRPVYEKVLAAAERNHIRVIGHVPFSLTIQEAMQEGHFSVEHLLGYERELVDGSRGFQQDWVDADPERMPQLAALTASLGAWNCPTNAIFIEFARAFSASDRAAYLGHRRQMVLALQKAGAKLLAGTDSGIGTTQPGTSIHDELADFVLAGLTPAEALRTATTRAAEFIGDDIGTIAPGARADLLLVDANPLADLSVLRHPPHLMLRGALYERK